MAGSLGYAGRLKNKKNLGGQLGATEFIEDVQTVKDKVQLMSDMVLSSQQAQKQVFFFTGAGISTSIGIPDFRGPNGIWTLKRKKRPVTAPLTPFEHAKPSFTHMVISAMVAAGHVNMVCSQNVDSLHLRSGVPRDKLAELHGNCFAERCSVCGHERVRDFQVETLGFKATGRVCSRPGCGGAMKDNVLDWDSQLPDNELEASIVAAETAGVCLVLGSSLQIAPANEIPLFTSENGGKLIIINLQKTPRDRSAAMLLRARVDAAMALLSLKLGLHIPPYVRLDGVAVCHASLPASDSGRDQVVASSAPPAILPISDQQVAGSSSGQAALVGPSTVAAEGQAAAGAQPEEPNSKADDSTWGFRLMVRSVHGQECLLPMVAAVSMRLEGDDGSGNVHVGQVHVSHVGCFQATGKGAASAQLAGDAEQPVGDTGAGSGVDQGVGHVEKAVCDELQGSGCVIAATPSTSGGVPLGGPYEFSATGIDQGVTSVRCHVQLHLAEWADADKRVVTLPAYTVTCGSVTCSEASVYPSDAAVAALVDGTQLVLPGQAPALVLQQLTPAAADQQQRQHPDVKDESKQPSETANAGVKAEANPTATDGTQDQDRKCDTLPPSVQASSSAAGLEGQQGAGPTAPLASGPHPCLAAHSDRANLFTYVSQSVQFDAAAVWGAYEANPPPVVAPPPSQPRKKRRSDPNVSRSQAADLAAAAAGVELRRSARRRGGENPDVPAVAGTTRSDDDDDDDSGEGK